MGKGNWEFCAKFSFFPTLYTCKKVTGIFHKSQMLVLAEQFSDFFLIFRRNISHDNYEKRGVPLSGDGVPLRRGRGGNVHSPLKPAPANIANLKQFIIIIALRFA